MSRLIALASIPIFAALGFVGCVPSFEPAAAPPSPTLLPTPSPLVTPTHFPTATVDHNNYKAQHQAQAVEPVSETPDPIRTAPTVAPTLADPRSAELTPTIPPPPTLTPAVVPPFSDPIGIPEIDAIVAAVEAGDMAAFKPLIRFNQLGCTHISGLGGPPKCEIGQTEGEVVSVLPILGSEGTFIFEAQYESWREFKDFRLVAVYRVSDAVYSDSDYPAGEIAILFQPQQEGWPEVIIHTIDGQVVRIDYNFSRTLDELLARDATETLFLRQN